MTARVARLELAIATISLKLSIWGSRRSCGAPPDSEMAVATRVASSALVTPAAMNAASHSRGPGGPPGWRSRGRSIKATTAARLNWARLNARLTPDCLSIQEQRQPGAEDAGSDVLGRWQQEQEGDARHLAQRERVPFAQEVDVDDVGLAEEERRRPPAATGCRNRAGRRRQDVADDRQVQDRGDRGDDDREAADPDGGRQPWRCDEARGGRLRAGSLDRGLGAVLACGCCHRDLGTA